MWTVILIIIALVYVLNPFDILPDLIVGWGWIDDISIEYENGDTITGSFFFNSFEETGAHNDAVTFSASLQNSGAWVYTAV